MSTATWKNLFLAGIACLVVALPARAAEVAAAPQDEAVDVKVDCLAPFAHLRSLAAEVDILAQDVEPELRSSSNCVRRGKGALAYCEGSCEYTHLTCKEVVINTGFICQCK